MCASPLPRTQGSFRCVRSVRSVRRTRLPLLPGKPGPDPAPLLPSFQPPSNPQPKACTLRALFWPRFTSVRTRAGPRLFAIDYRLLPSKHAKRTSQTQSHFSLARGAPAHPLRPGSESDSGFRSGGHLWSGNQEREQGRQKKRPSVPTRVRFHSPSGRNRRSKVPIWNLKAGPRTAPQVPSVRVHRARPERKDGL